SAVFTYTTLFRSQRIKGIQGERSKFFRSQRPENTRYRRLRIAEGVTFIEDKGHNTAYCRRAVSRGSATQHYRAGVSRTLHHQRVGDHRAAHRQFDVTANLVGNNQIAIIGNAGAETRQCTAAQGVNFVGNIRQRRRVQLLAIDGNAHIAAGAVKTGQRNGHGGFGRGRYTRLQVNQRDNFVGSTALRNQDVGFFTFRVGQGNALFRVQVVNAFNTGGQQAAVGRVSLQQTVQLGFGNIRTGCGNVGDGNNGRFTLFGSAQFQLVLWRYGIGFNFNRLRLHTNVAIRILAVQLTVNSSGQLLHRAEFFIQRNQHRAAAVVAVGGRYGEVNTEAVGAINLVSASHG